MYNLKIGNNFNNTINPDFSIEPNIPYIYVSNHNETSIKNFITQLLPTFTCIDLHCYQNSYCDSVPDATISFNLGPEG